MTPRDLEKKIAGILEQGYLKNPRVNVEVLNFRPFFILGEVNKPGSYPYSNDMSVINAVALGGGYTTRAKTGQVKIRRATTPEKEEWVGEDAAVYPGDAIRVDERFF
jgi:protein involved in polysaccharide export with SLBB domain